MFREQRLLSTPIQKEQVIPVLLGSDLNAYAIARAFHEQYGITSHCVESYQLAATRFSSIVTPHIVKHFDQPDVFVSTLRKIAQQFKEQQPEAVLLLIPCSDVYVPLISKFKNELTSDYVFHFVDIELVKQLTNKSSFYALCNRYGLPHPKTISLSKYDVYGKKYQHLPFDYPVAMKPADSVQWLTVNFNGRKKAYIFHNPEELEIIIQRAYEAGYSGEMIIQDFIPGDDSHMRVLNAYVDKHHHVRMMMLGHPLLEDPSPIAVGNYTLIMPDNNEEICKKIADFLNAIHYEGIANFDMKYDERDGEYKLFEINLRPGRSIHYVLLNQCNIAQYYVDDLILSQNSSVRPKVVTGDSLWVAIPPTWISRYVENDSNIKLAINMVKQ